MKPSAPRRSHGEWADKLSSGLVRRRLTAALITSQTHDEFDIPELSLPDNTQRTCDAVLSRRCQFGDIRKHVGRLRHLMLGVASCPFGCVDDKGTTLQFTWDHVQFRCQNSEIQEAQTLWSTKLHKAIRVLDEEGTPHTQAHEVYRRVTAGLKQHIPGAPKASPWNKQTEITARRFVGGLIRGTADHRLNKSKQLRSVLAEATTAGTQVQQIALKITREFEEELLATSADLRKISKFAKHWLKVTQESGPARVAALRGVHDSNDRVIARILTLRDQHSTNHRVHQALQMDGYKLRIALTGTNLESIRRTWPRRREEAYRDWRHLALLTRWRLRAAMHQRSSDTDEELRRSRWRRWRKPPAIPCEDVRGRDLVARAAGAYLLSEFHSYLTSSPRIREADAYEGEAVMWIARFQRASNRLATGLVQYRSLIGREIDASGKWNTGGAIKGERRRNEARRLQAARSFLIYHKKSLKNYARQGQIATLGISGMPLEVVENMKIFNVETKRTKKRQGNWRTSVRKRARIKAGKKRTAEAFDSGETLDKFQRHKVMKIVDVQRNKSGNKRGWLEALLRWAGTDKTGMATSGRTHGKGSGKPMARQVYPFHFKRRLGFWRRSSSRRPELLPLIARPPRA